MSSGGGLLSHGTCYSWLSSLSAGLQTVNQSNSGDLYRTAAGAGLLEGVDNEVINSGPWHNYFEGDLSGLAVLVASTEVDASYGPAAVIVASESIPIPELPGYVESAGIWREPLGEPPLFSPDGTVYTDDYRFRLQVTVVDPPVGSLWTWRYYYPETDPGTAPPDFTCWHKLAAAEDQQNPSGMIAHVHNCPGFVSVIDTYPGGCPCVIEDPFGAWITPDEGHVGPWKVIVDYTDPSGAEIPAVIQSDIHLERAPAVLVIHGYNVGCGSLDTFMDLLREELGVSSSRVQCYGYDSRKGVAPAAIELAWRVREFRADLDLAPDAPIHLVGHSMGGLVARYYREHLYGSPDGPIATISMLGTPNNGVALAKFEQAPCIAASAVPVVGPLLGAGCATIDWVDLEDDITGFDPDSAGVDDMTPGSTMLHALNDHFVLPPTPQYWAYIGHKGGYLGLALNFLDPDNDCLIAASSVRGPGGVFADVRADYPDVSHGLVTLPGACDEPSLVTSSEVAADIAAFIKGTPPSGADPVLASGHDRAPAEVVFDYVQPSETKVASIAVPPGLPSAEIVVLWKDAPTTPDLSVTVRRPGGQVVDANDPDVISDVALTGDGGSVHVLAKGFALSAPAAGTWEVSVEGVAVQPGGEPFFILLVPESEVGLEVDTSVQLLAPSEPVVLTARLTDVGVPVEATSITSDVILPGGGVQSVTLVDDGTSGDVVAGDLLYSVAFGDTEGCGTYGAEVRATGDTSEGTVSRVQFAFFSVAVPGDAVRDHCDPDEDEDGLSDTAELETYVTDPFDGDSDDDDLDDGTEILLGTDPHKPDTDDDGMDDAFEVDPLNSCLQPLVADGAADPDADGLTSLAEYNDAGTLPCDPDTDDDVVLDGPDNCKLDANPDQANTDSVQGNGLPVPGDDTTVPNSDEWGDACDEDDDNDGLWDEDELSPDVCAPFDLSGTTHPAPAGGDITSDDDGDGIAAPPLHSDAGDNGPSWDTDNDGQIDGWECANGYNPRDAASKDPGPLGGGVCRPLAPLVTGPPLEWGGTPDKDTDDDGLLDMWELCKWGTDPDLTDTDGDGVSDCREAADIDGSGVPNITDVVIVAQAALLNVGRDWPLDFDGGGIINITDANLVAQLALQGFGTFCNAV
ncbi:MAG: choice-of-anchor X domain-containing protein [Dehalococcoidia bacterium]